MNLHSQKRHRLDASCGFYRPDASCQQVVSSLLTSPSCIKSGNIRLAAAGYLQTCYKLMKQLASSLHQFTTCSKSVIFKPEQAMRTHPDIGLVMQLARFLLCSTQTLSKQKEMYSNYLTVIYSKLYQYRLLVTYDAHGFIPETNGGQICDSNEILLWLPWLSLIE